MKKFTADIFVNKKQHGTTEAPHIYGCANDAFKNALGALYRQRGLGLGLKEVEGDKVTLDVRIVLKCVMNRRAPRRPPAVIAQEKQTRLDRAQKRALQEQSRKAQAEIRREHVRQQITNQFDHAFASGVSTGTDPVAKFITCMHCAAPAVLLHLNLPIPTGAAVLDEGTIVGAVCADHNYPGYRNTVAEVIPCARLEFFYDGIRQIAIKTERAA